MANEHNESNRRRIKHGVAQFGDFAVEFKYQAKPGEKTRARAAALAVLGHIKSMVKTPESQRWEIGALEIIPTCGKRPRDSYYKLVIGAWGDNGEYFTIKENQILRILAGA